MTLGPRGLRYPQCPKERPGCLWNPAPFTRPLGALGSLGKGTLVTLVPWDPRALMGHCSRVCVLPLYSCGGARTVTLLIWPSAFQ